MEEDENLLMEENEKLSMSDNFINQTEALMSPEHRNTNYDKTT